MADFSLNAVCINYSNVINNVMIKFFDDFNNSFIRENNKYVFSDSITKIRLRKYLCDLVIKELQSYLTHVSRFDKVYLIGSCKVNNNIIFNGDKSEYNITYKLLEDDIYIDLIKFEDIFDEIFKSLKFKNIILVRHLNLSYFQIHNIIEKHFGKNHCKELNFSKKDILYDLNNDIVSDKKYLISIKDKISFNVNEVLEFIKKT